MEYVPPETFMFLATSLMANLHRGHSDNRRCRRSRSFFGTNPETCSDVWTICFDSFMPTTMPIYFLWTLMFLKQHRTEEANVSITGCDEDAFRKWVWHMLSVISKVNVVNSMSAMINLIF